MTDIRYQSKATELTIYLTKFPFQNSKEILFVFLNTYAISELFIVHSLLLNQPVQIWSQIRTLRFLPPQERGHVSVDPLDRGRIEWSVSFLVASQLHIILQVERFRIHVNALLKAEIKLAFYMKKTLNIHFGDVV